MALNSYKPLRLMAADTEDLEIISTVLQDAVLKIGDMAFIKGQRRFVFLANRFVWEEGASRTHGPFTRVRTGLHFDDVTAVRAQNIRQDAPSAVLSFLAARFEAGEDGAGTVTLDFSGGGRIALDVLAINATLKDISQPWRTRNKPGHALD